MAIVQEAWALMTKGHAKGSAFERTICVALSRFIDPEGQDTHFWRSSLSGGRATIQNRKGGGNKTQLGDISAIDGWGETLTLNFVFECKFYRKLDLESSLLFNRGKLARFWKQLVALAHKHNRHPVLIARQNRTETLVVLDYQGLKTLRQEWGLGNSRVLILVHSETMKASVCLFKEVFGHG